MSFRKILENLYYLLREFLWKITLYLLRHLEYPWLNHLLHAWHYGMSADPDPGTRFYRGLKIFQIGLLVFNYKFLLGLDITLWFWKTQFITTRTRDEVTSNNISEHQTKELSDALSIVGWLPLTIDPISLKSWTPRSNQSFYNRQLLDRFCLFGRTLGR